jgi:hypothetical protein
MATRPADLVRAWVRLYTAGLPPDVGVRRRDEIDSDLWSQGEDAMLTGRTTRSLDAEVLVRLVAGMPADVGWRFWRGMGRPIPAGVPREKGSGSRFSATLAIGGGLSLVLFVGLLVALLAIDPASMESRWGEPATGIALLLLGGGGLVAISFANAGLVLLFLDRLSPPVALAGSIGTLGGSVGTFGGGLGLVAFLLASSCVVANLAYAGLLGRRLAVGYGVSAVAFAIPLVLGPLSLLGVLLIAAVPFALAWVAIGRWLALGVPDEGPASIS